MITMNNIAISARDVSKWFRIEQDAKKPRYLTLRDQFANMLSAPFSRFSGPSKNGANQNGKKHQYEVWALKDVSFDIEKGEVVGLIGPNGAGKSTLLKVLTRITEPTHGSIDIYGRIGSLLEVGTGFHKELTGRDNVFLNGAILGMRKQEIAKKFDEIVSFSEVEKFIDTPVKFYSSGMTVRLAFSVAAHLDPEILLVDEVLAVGDAAFQKKSLSKMESVGKSGRTVVFVSHHMPSITRLCERALLLNHGQLVMNGPADQVVADYLSENLGTTAYKEWTGIVPSPGSDVTRLRSARVINDVGITNYSFDIRKPVGIEFTYDILTQTGYAINPYFTIQNEEEVLLFTSFDTDADFRRRPRQPGRYRSVAWIPGNLLSEGVMTISAGLRTEMPHIIHCFERDVVAFQVIESPEGSSARMDYAGKIHGAVRPLLKWETDFNPNPEVIYGSIGGNENGYR